MERRRVLFRNIKLFSVLIDHTHIVLHFDNYPVFYPAQNGLSSFLMNKGIMFSSFVYPTPEDDLITRVVINSNHQKEDIRFHARCVIEYVKTNVL
ncbi:MAG: hypothetical protein ABI594_15120 [Ginsengibacter sp.]